MPKAFVSHSHNDADRVHEVARLLKECHDVSVWLDKWSILPGDVINQEIERGIEDSRFLILMLSKSALESGFVDREWRAKFDKEIRDKRVYVIMVLLDRLDEAQIPAFLQSKLHLTYTDAATIATRLAESMKQHEARDFSRDMVDALNADRADGPSRMITTFWNHLSLEPFLSAQDYVGASKYVSASLSSEITYHTNWIAERKATNDNESEANAAAKILLANTEVKLTDVMDQYARMRLRITSLLALLEEAPDTAERVWNAFVCEFQSVKC